MNAPWSTIPQLVDDAAIRFGDSEAFVDEDRRWTFTQYRDQIHAAARAFMGHDVQPGDRNAVWAPNIRLLYTSDAVDETLREDPGDRRLHTNNKLQFVQPIITLP